MSGRLATAAALSLTQVAGVTLVFPSVDSLLTAADRDTPPAEIAASAVGIPNRVVALVPAGRGPEIAAAAVEAAKQQWQSWMESTFIKKNGPDLPTAALPKTPGVPAVQWVCVPAANRDGYAHQWRDAQIALGARRRLRDFGSVEDLHRWPCSLSPRWPAENQAPPGGPKHERETLSAVNWVKRRWHSVRDADERQVGFPSTMSIASAPLRQWLLRQFEVRGIRDAVRELRLAVHEVVRVNETAVAGLRKGDQDPLARWFACSAGPWLYPSVWDPPSLWREYGNRRTPVPEGFADTTRCGDRAARRLLAIADGRQPDEIGTRVPPPPSYLALIAQDLDNMGKFLSGEIPAVNNTLLSLTRAEHQRVSRQLVNLGRDQVERLIADDLLGVPVYAGGDDLLAFTPAATALRAAAEMRRLVDPGLPTASTAVVFFHHTSSLRAAVVEVRRLLEEAKAADPTKKNALGVGFLRRSGVREYSIQPWTAPSGRTAADLFEVFTAAGTDRSLSPRIVTELERDETELAELEHSHPSLFDAELTRLVLRHHGSAEDAAALRQLGRSEGSVREGLGPTRDGTNSVPAKAARVAVFLRQECARGPVPERPDVSPTTKGGDQK